MLAIASENFIAMPNYAYLDLYSISLLWLTLEHLLNLFALSYHMTSRAVLPLKVTSTYVDELHVFISLLILGIIEF
jgi:hypothetical protein